MSIPGALPAAMAKRLLAHLIDQVATLLVGGAFVLAGLVPVLQGMVDEGVADGTGAPSPLSPLSVAGAVLLLGLWLFQWWYQGTRGFTIGKRLVGLRTLSARSGRPVGMGKILLRMLVVAAGALVLVVGQLVVYLSPFFDSTGRRQGWHDKAAGTMVFDVAVGRDPADADQVRGAADAVRRLDALMQARGGGTVRSAGPAGADPVGAAPASGELPPEPAESELSMASAPAHAAPNPFTPSPAPGPASPVPASGPVAIIAPRLPGRSEPPPPPGIISSVPRAGDEPEATSAPQPVARPPVAEAQQPPPREVPRPRTGSPAGPPSVPPSATVATGLPEDVERTRLRPARAKVPEVPDDGSRVEVVIELTDGRRFTLEGTALVGRRPAPRAGEEGVQLIRVADPGRSVSKTHLCLGVDRSGVWVRDRDSTNGTVVTLADGQQILCAAEQQVRLPAGASVAFGDYGLTVAEPDA